jgi:hypothetical protein
MDTVYKYPHFVIGGAPKCGTSSLYFWLASHPNIVGSRVKEPFFFADQVNRFNKGLNCIENPITDYQQHFENAEAGKLSMESTAHYLYYQNAIDGLQKLPIKPKVIFLLREPSAQLLSHYNMLRYRTKRIKLTLPEYIEQSEVLEKSNYAKYIARWQNEYGPEYIKVVLFEDLMRHKKKVLQEITAFLEIDGTFYNHFDFEHRNKSVAVKSGFLHHFGLKVQRYIPFGVQKLLMPVYLKLNSGKIPKLSAEDELLLARIKQNKVRENQKLKILLPNLDFSYWD